MGTGQRGQELAEWVALYHAARELSRRGFVVGHTLRNMPMVDLTATKDGRTITIDTKGSTQPHWMTQNLLKGGRETPNHFVILVYTPPPPRNASGNDRLPEPRAFVLRGADAVRITKETVRLGLERWKSVVVGAYLANKDPRYPTVSEFEDRWDLLDTGPGKT